MNNEPSPPVSETRIPAPSQKVVADSKIQPIKNTLELGGKMLFGLAGLCYVLGLVVVTIHLRGYGLNSLSLSQLHYVTAGVWVLLPILVMIFLIIFAKFVIDAQEGSWKTKTKHRRALGILYIIATVLIVFYVAIEYLGKPFGIHLSLTNWVLIPGVGTLAFSMLAAAVYMLMSSDAGRPSTVVSLGVGVFAVLMFMVYVVLFAGHTYREIPWATGGARPSRVELVVSIDSKPYFESVGIRFSAGQNLTDSVQLLLVTDNDYIIINPEGKAVSVPIGSVKSVIYEK